MTSFVKALKPVILVTGGTGYIGSHAVVALIAAGYDPIIIDNLSNSNASVLERIAKITGKRPPFYKIDLRDIAALDKVFQKHPIRIRYSFCGTQGNRRISCRAFALLREQY